VPFTLVNKLVLAHYATKTIATSFARLAIELNHESVQHFGGGFSLLIFVGIFVHGDLPTKP
jgi:hypothetical protein